MEEKEAVVLVDNKAKIKKLIPTFLLTFVILFIGLSFIGNLFTVTHVEGELIVLNAYSMVDLLFKQPAGITPNIYFIILYLAGPIIAGVLLLFSKYKKNLGIISALLFLLFAVSSIVTKEVFTTAIRYFIKNTEGVKYTFEVDKTSFAYFIPTISYFVSFVVALAYTSDTLSFSTRDIAEMGILIAAAVGLNFLTLFKMPTGGSVNLQMLPLFLLALRRGPLKGFVAGGIVYGLITCLTDGYGFATFPFDYLVGFGSIAVLGLFSSLILDGKGYTLKSEVFLFVAGILSTLVRFIGGSVSSMVIYGYDFIGAATYNAAYIFISGGIALALVMSLLGPIKRVNKLFPVNKDNDLPED